MGYDLLVQFAAIVALLAFAGSFQSKTRKGILFWQIISLAFWTLHYSLLSAWTGALLVFINGIITIFFLFKEAKPWINASHTLYSALLLLTLATIATWKGVYSLFALGGVSFITVAKWQTDLQKIRLISILASLSWIIYDVFVRSWGGMITETAIIISIVISLIRAKRAR